MKLKKWLFKSLIYIGLGLSSTSIAQSNLWVVGQNVVKFNSGGIVSNNQLPIYPYPIGNQWRPDFTTLYVSNAYQDENGNLLFYIADSKIYDSEGRYIGLLEQPMYGALKGTVEWAIVPAPCESNVFYIVGEEQDEPLHTKTGVTYSFYTRLELGVDINATIPNGISNFSSDPLADGRIGFANDPDYYPSQQMRNLYLPSCEGSLDCGQNSFAVSKLMSDNKRYLFNLQSGSIIGFDVDVLAQGLNNPPSFNPGTIGARQGLLELELVQKTNGDFRFVFTTQGSMFDVEDYSYNPISHTFNLVSSKLFNYGGIPSGSNKISGIELDKTGRYVYFTFDPGTSPTNNNNLYYFDADASPSTPIYYSLTGTGLIPTTTFAPFKYSQIEMGADGALYFLTDNGGGTNPNKLGKLTNPSNPTSITGANFSTINLSFPVYKTKPYTLAALNNYFYTLNDQIDGEAPYSWSLPIDINTETKAECCINSHKYTIDSYTVTGSYNQTWSPGNNPFLNTTLPVSVKTRLVIPEGYNITIQNMVFEFKPFIGDPNAGGGFTDGAKCILQASQSGSSLNGARVNLQGTNFKGATTCYYGMWDGVEVQGVSSAPQLVIGPGGYSSKQARLTLSSNSVIQDAYFGATNYVFDLNTSSSLAHETSPLQSGGVIVAQASSFKNNFMGVVFMPYSAANVVSSFKTTNFLVDAPLKNPLIKPFAMAFVFSNKILSFNKCVFKNLVPSVYPIVNLGSPLQNVHGIFAIDASFNALGGPAIGVPYGIGCTFENLTYGVRAFNLNTNTALIQSSTFKNNWRGSYFSNYTGASVTKVQRNKYFVYEYADGTPAKDAAYGHYLDYCNNFIVQENNFYYNSYNETSGTPVGGVFNAYGCIVNEENPKQLCENVGYKGDRVYKNLFKEIKFGAQAQGSNSEMPNVLGSNPSAPCHNGNTSIAHNQGLKYVCNTFSGTDANDITVMMNGAINDPGRIAYQQGDAGQVAGNVFSHITTPINCNSGITSSSERELYVDKTGINDTKPNYLQYTSNNAPAQQLYCFSPLSIAPNPSSTNVNTGADARPIIGTNSCPSQIITLSSTGSTHVFKLLGKQIDDLNQKLIDGDAETLITLINNGSNGQIKTGLLNKSPYLSDRVLITAVNKQLPDGTIKDILLANSPVTAPVKQAVDASTLSNGIKNQIVAAQTGISGRAILESQISQLKDEQHIYEIEALFAAQNDSLIQTTDSVINLIDYFGGEGKTQKKIKVHLSKNDLTKANQELNVLATDLGTSHPDYEYLNTIKEVYTTYNKGALGIINDATALNVIDATSQRTLEYDSKGALGIKEFFRLAANREWIQGKPNASSQRVGHTDDESSISVVENNNFKIYPNPSTGIFFYQVLSDELNDATLEVYDLTGKRIISGALSNNNANGYIDLSSVTNGIYFVKVANTQKILFNTKINVVK